MEWWVVIVLILVVAVVAYYITPPQYIQSVLSSLTGKPKYYCDSTNTTCINLIVELEYTCSNSVITRDFPSITSIEDITRNGDNCHIVYTVDRAAISGWKGLSMTCDIPMAKIGVVKGGSSGEFIKYCEGSLKDEYYRIMIGLLQS
jgi:hypothetical protein